MPSNSVRTKKDERLWARAKHIVEAQRGRPDDYWALVQHIYQKMKKGGSARLGGPFERMTEAWLRARRSREGPFSSLLAKAGPYVGPKGGKWADPQHKIPWSEKKHAGKPAPKVKAHDQRKADKLRMWIDNTEEFASENRGRFGAGYRDVPTHRGSIHRNLANKIAAGKYDHAQASRAFGHLVDAASKHYGSNVDPVHHRGGSHQFDAATRAAVAREMADDFHDEVRAGDHDRHLNKKHKKLHPRGISSVVKKHGR